VDNARIRNHQTLFREVNSRIVEISEAQQEAASEFICECGRPDCTTLIELALVEYRNVRAEGDYFVAAEGHCVEGVDRKVESRDGFDILAQI
jgi:hypothetical protein